ncbi:hypothetical protein [Shewanella fodinae]|uniref:RexA-like intracellular sensor of abortive infection system n=1 Tax=Shewanella fodinae TaxID=552357 RepID=A0A4R2F1B5_9GAMM|nr:hypothetical protein [Shewanella fodinae]TCN78035.1 RexA-like intracellular sensor of abortive infection system [Shewanella fodinae]
MKLYYFSYIIRKISTQEKYLHNIADLLGAFHKSNNVALKSSFKRGDEKLYLTKIDGYLNTYYFLKTSNDDLLKRINEQNFTVSDIKDKLESGEKMAFTAHIHFSTAQPILAIASGIGCPRLDVFADYTNELFKKVGLNDYEVEFTALSANSTKKDLLEMEVVNSIFIDIDADEGIGKTFLKELAGEYTSGVGSFRVTVESTQGNIKDTFRKIIKKNDQDKNRGIIRVGAKAKHDELTGQLMDYWLDNENVLADKINPKAKRKSIADQIGEKFDQNSQAITLYEKFINNQPNVNSTENATLTRFNAPESFNVDLKRDEDDENTDSEA